MTREEAEKYAKKMTYHEAIHNLKQAKSVPYRKATFTKVNELLNDLEQEPRWIPVTEKLPEKDAFYLVTEKSGRVCTYVFHKGNSEEYWKRCAVAWMPLPKPYGLESEGK